jgi:non-canonical purine NTP pyrophosphatase (RdgB/HAM1 family)
MTHTPGTSCQRATNQPAGRQYSEVDLDVLITSNEKKREEFCRILGREIQKRTLSQEIIEPQPDFEMMRRSDYSECSSITVQQKARDAYFKNGNQPCFVEDTALYIDALEGFPGTLIKYRCSSEQGLRGLCRDVHDPVMGSPLSARAVAIVALAAWNGTEDAPQCWLGIVEGTIAREPRGPMTFGFDCIFVPSGSSETLAELWARNPTEKDAFSPRRLAIEELKKRPFLIRASS